MMQPWLEFQGPNIFQLSEAASAEREETPEADGSAVQTLVPRNKR